MSLLVPRTKCNETASSIFHLHSTRSTWELTVMLVRQHLHYDPFLVYLGVTFDWTLSYKELESQNNLLAKLVETTWGANANTLRQSALALCYSVADYCAPVWAQSTYTRLVDAQLNNSMRLISGALRPTPLPWLPDLSHIESPALRCKAAVDRLVAKATVHHAWPLNSDLLHPPQHRL